MQQGVQTDATCNVQQCCVRLYGALAVCDFWANKLLRNTDGRKKGKVLVLTPIR